MVTSSFKSTKFEKKLHYFAKNVRSKTDDMCLHVFSLVTDFHCWALSPRRRRIPRKSDEPQTLDNLPAIFV